MNLMSRRAAKTAKRFAFVEVEREQAQGVVRNTSVFVRLFSTALKGLLRVTH